MTSTEASFSKEEFKKKVVSNCKSLYRKNIDEADKQQVFQSVAYAVKDLIIDKWIATHKTYDEEDPKVVYYMSMEFLMGRALGNNMINLTKYHEIKEALNELGLDINVIEDQEPDAALGNGGLGRLAAAFMDSLATTGYPGFGNGLRYRYGLFKQRIVDGYQVELPDGWFGSTGNVWETRKDHDIVYVKLFGDVVLESNEDGRFVPTYKNAQVLRAVPYDVPQIGYKNGVINNLRLWDVEIPEEYALDYPTLDARRRVKDITAILYPDDSTIEGKELRLVQEYFMTSAGLQTIIKSYLKMGLPLKDIHEKVSVHINDTHPAVAPAEFMRLLLDEYGLSWEDAWNATVKTMSYTNHTILQEALEKWDQQLFKRVLPRVYQIILEIDNRYIAEMAGRGVAADVIERTRIVKDNQVHMANLAIIGGHSVNGVAKLHTELLKEDTLHDFYTIYPEKFNNKTNGIVQRRWTQIAAPELSAAIDDVIGDGWRNDIHELENLTTYLDDKEVLNQFYQVKKTAKQRLADYIKETTGVEVSTDAIFDVQVKRLHAYKRQLLNLLHIIKLYWDLKDNPDKDMVPRVFIFGAKAAPGYHFAKSVIKLINEVANLVNNDESLQGKLKVVFLENYRVSLAELIIPAADVSEQISLASKEASGTGNMKFMLNGALTLGTMDGANVEIAELVGPENIFTFGKDSDTIIDLYEKEGYVSRDYYEKDANIKAAVDFIVSEDLVKVGDKERLERLHKELISKDWFMTLIDLAEYIDKKEEVYAAYEDQDAWNKKVVYNIAEAGFFSSDRTIEQYDKDIWHTK